MPFSLFLDSSVGIPIDILSSGVDLKISSTTAVTKNYNSINVIKRKSMAKKVLLTKFSVIYLTQISIPVNRTEAEYIIDTLNLLL